MAESKIEWTDATWNPIGGCSIKSPGCKPCYAQQLAGTRLLNHPLYAGTTTPNKDGKPVFNGHLTVAADFHPVWTWPLSWRGAKAPTLGVGKPSLIFVGDMSDLFHEDRPIRDIDRVIIAGARSRHVLQLLTKRADVMANYVENLSWRRAVNNCCTSETDPLPMISQNTFDDLERMFGLKPRFLHQQDCSQWPSPRIWLGFSAERQQEFDERWPSMRRLADMGWTIFCSHEPALGPITYPADFLALGDRAQVIAGGTSGNDAMPSHPDWFRHDRDQCAAAGAPFFFKQWGAFSPVRTTLQNFLHPIDQHLGEKVVCAAGVFQGYPEFPAVEFDVMRRASKSTTGRLLDGVEHNGMPRIAA
jgi:protein gp37